MIISWHGNTFHITGLLWGESTSDWRKIVNHTLILISLSDKLWYLQHSCVGDTIVYHWTRDISAPSPVLFPTHQLPPFYLEIHRQIGLWGQCKSCQPCVWIVPTVAQMIHVLKSVVFQTKTWVVNGTRGVRKEQPPLTHWSRVMHICVNELTIIGSDNGLSPDRRQAIIWTIDEILWIGPLGTKISEILIEIQTFSFRKMHLKISSGKWQPFVSASMC